MTFDPLRRGILPDQEVVPVAVPLPPRELDQLICVTPKGPVKLSEAVPAMLSGVPLAEEGVVAGFVIVTVGAVVSAGFIAVQPAMVLPPAFKKVSPVALRAGGEV